MERGGPDGADVVFNLQAPDGKLTDVPTRDLEVIHTTTADEVHAAWDRRHS